MKKSHFLAISLSLWLNKTIKLLSQKLSIGNIYRETCLLPHPLLLLLPVQLLFSSREENAAERRDVVVAAQLFLHLKLNTKYTPLSQVYYYLLDTRMCTMLGIGCSCFKNRKFSFIFF